MTKHQALPARSAQGVGHARRWLLRRAAARRRAAAVADHAGADRGGQEGGQARLLHRHGPGVRGAAGQDVRGEVSRHRRARGALRRRARLHPHRPGIRQQHPRRRRGQHRGPGALHRLEAQRLARAVPAGGGREAFRQELLRPGRAARHDAHPGLADRLQHQPGEEGGCAEELRRPARSEMGGQDGQGASGLQRHDHERDLPDRARSRLGLFREARQAARHAGAVGDRHAEEDRARRARGDGRRRRLSRHPLQGRRPAGRDRLSGGGHAARRPVRARCSRRRPTRMPRACSRTGCTRARRSRSWSTGRASIRRTGRPWKSPASGSSPTSS